jgi:hypothetical protein
MCRWRNTDTYAYGHCDGYSHGDSYRNGNGHSYSDGYCYSYSYSYSGAQVDAFAKASWDSATAAIAG